MTEYTFEVNRFTISKRVHCPHCNSALDCWGYMVDANCNCRFCNKQFVLTEELWNTSFVVATNECNNCQFETEHAILKHDPTFLEVKCLSCDQISKIEF